MRHLRVKITRDQNTVHNRAVPIWEIPVLEYLFGDGNLVETEDYVEVTPKAGQSVVGYPDAREEFEDLAKRYGVDTESKLPFVALVYGNAGVGVRALRKAIAEAKAEDEIAAKDAAKKPKVVDKPVRKESRLAKRVEQDALLG